jgi:hypothetical protein
MEVKVGIRQTREIELDLPDDTDRDALAKDVEKACAGDDIVLWLTDKRGRLVGIPASQIAYVEIGSPNDERRVGFGAH